MVTSQNCFCTRYDDDCLRVIDDHCRTFYDVADAQFVKKKDGCIVHPTDFVKVDAMSHLKFCLEIHGVLHQLCDFIIHRLAERVIRLAYTTDLRIVFKKKYSTLRSWKNPP